MQVLMCSHAPLLHKHRNMPLMLADVKGDGSLDGWGRGGGAQEVHAPICRSHAQAVEQKCCVIEAAKKPSAGSFLILT